MTTSRLPDPSPCSQSHSKACWWHPLEARWVCRPGPLDNTPLSDEDLLVDVRDMLVVHTALLREFRLAPAAVRRVDVGDRRQARRVVDHLRFVGDMLHHHHEGEDELLWPSLVERAPALTKTLSDGEAQHTALNSALADVTHLQDSWADRVDGKSREALAARLDELSLLLREHLELEERDVLPIAAAVLNTDEWSAIGRRAAAAMSKPGLALAFGMFAYEGDPATLAQMLGEAPRPVRALLRLLAPRLYARRARRIHGTRWP